MNTWKPIVGFDDYEVSDSGLIRRAKPSPKGAPVGTILRTRRNRSNGYRCINLCVGGKTRTRLLHLLVAEAFLGPRPAGQQVNHRDCDRGNNAIANLEFVTPKENTNHAGRAGRLGRKLTAENVLEIRQMAAGKMSKVDIAAKFGVAAPTISNIVHRKRWAHSS